MLTEAGSDRSRHLVSLDVLAVEPYFGGSHRHFLEGLCTRSSHRVRTLTLPGRNWKWRMHGGAITLADQARDLVGAPCSHPSAPDVLFVSDMLDLPTFLSLSGPGFADIPAIVYFHENQFTYPLPEGVQRDLGYGMRNLVSALAARSVLFNSEHHRREFLAAVDEALAAVPDEVPTWVVGALRERAKVLPVGCDLRGLDTDWERSQQDVDACRWGDPADGPLVLWNQRWEYDKAPADLFAALAVLREEGVPFRLAVVGKGHGAPLPEFERALEDLGDTIVQWGHLVERADYASLLWAADVVVSTAIHEFFGIAVVEAIYCGCRPVLPRRLSYPEIIPGEAHEDVLYREGDLVAALRRALEQPAAWSEDWQRTWVARYDWAVMGPRYDEEIRRCWKASREERAWRG